MSPTSLAETTLDLAPLLAFRAECGAMALRIASGQVPPEGDHDELERRAGAVEQAFIDSLLGFVGDEVRPALSDALAELAGALTGTGPLSVLADEAYAAPRTDRLALRLLARMIDTGAGSDELSAVYDDVSADLTPAGRAACESLLDDRGRADG